MKNNLVRIIAIVIVALILILVIGGAIMLRTGQYLDDNDAGKYESLDAGHYKIVPAEFFRTFADTDELLMEAVDAVDYSEEASTYEVTSAMLVAYPLSGLGIIEEIWGESSDLWELDEINALVEGCSPENVGANMVNMIFTKAVRENGRKVRYQTTFEYDVLNGYIHWGTAKITGSKIPLETVSLNAVSEFTQMLIDIHSDGGDEFEDAVDGACTTQALSGGVEWEFFYWDDAGDHDPFHLVLDGDGGEVE